MTIITDEMWKAFWDAADPAGGRRPLNVDAGLSAVSPLIAAAEREACAKVAAQYRDDFCKDQYDEGCNDTAILIEKAISARSS